MQSPEEKSLSQLGQMFLIAKDAETRAINSRRMIGAEIVKMLPAKSDIYEGIANDVTPEYKIGVTYAVTRKVDDVEELRAKIPAPIFDRLIRFAPSVNLEELRYLERNEPDFYAIVAEHITTKPSAPSIKVEKV